MADGEPNVALKREIIEARNQAIKTDNQIKNLSMDVRSFEKRFDALESRVRLSSVAVNLLVALTLAACAYIVVTVITSAYEKEIAQLKDSARGERQTTEADRVQMERKLDEAQASLTRRREAGQKALGVIELIERREEREAGERLDEVDLAALTPLERSLCEARFSDLRKRQAASAYRAGRTASFGHDIEGAIAAWTRSLRLDGEGPFARGAREQLAWAHWQAKQYAQVEPLVRAWLNKEPDEASGAARFLLAASLARLGKNDAARTEFLQVGETSRYAPAARAYLAALEAGEELPVDLPGGRVRAQVRPAAAEPVAPSAQPAQ